MPISIACSCGKSEEAPDSFAGKFVRCQACGARIKVGFPVVESPAAPEGAGAALSYSSPNRGNVVISRERMLAGRICFCWGGIDLFLSSCIGLAFVFALFRPLAGRGLALASNGAMLAILLALAVTYIIGGINIRRGGMVSVIVCLVLASVQLLFSGVMTLLYIPIAVIKDPMMFIPVLLCLLVAAAFGQLDYYLIKILRQPRAAA